MRTVTVATLVRGRCHHLINLVRGLAEQTFPPTELIVAVMGGGFEIDLPATAFPVHRISVAAGEALPLAAARNAAAAAAVGEILIFLDADCIPAPELCVDYALALSRFDGIVMGEVLYLPSGVNAPGWTSDALAKVAIKHSDRQGPPPTGLEHCRDYRCFWSLNFALWRARFSQSGGFDERYVGYGGEDTDFAKTLSMAGIGLAWTKGALAYHQYHSHNMPPVHHLASVVRNAQVFEGKWGYRTMGHWLYAFRLMGLIDDRPGRPIRILRQPNTADFALTGQLSHQPYTNTASVIRRLEAEISDRRKEESGAVPA